MAISACRFGFERHVVKAGNACDEECQQFCTNNPDLDDYAAYGNGSASTPYVICTVAQFVSMSADSTAWDDHYLLARNLDMSAYDETNYTVIGNVDTPFSGTFDGNQNTIANFKYSAVDGEYIGLFGRLYGRNSQIRNLHLTNVAIVGNRNVGGLVGSVYQGRIFNATVAGTIHGTTRVGGLVGESDYAIISSSGTNVSIQAIGSNFYFGGLIGISVHNIVRNSFAKGDIHDDSGIRFVGGLLGRTTSGQVHDCFATGNVRGRTSIGGFVGHDFGSLTRNSYATGNVTSSIANAQISLFIGDKNGTLQGENNYFNSSATCTGPEPTVCENAILNPTGIDLLMQPDYFSGRNATVHEPLKSWNFRDAWQVHTNGSVVANPSYWDYESWVDCDSHLKDTPFAGGLGTAESPYLICSSRQLQALGASPQYWDKYFHFRLMQDIDLDSITGTDYNIIGTDANPFKGHFDGDGYRIVNFSYADSERDLVGLFGFVDEARIERVALKDVAVVGRNRVGGLIGYGQLKAHVLDVYVTGSVSGETGVGGIFGRSSYARLLRSYSTANVTGVSFVGGLIGQGGNTTVDSCFVSGEVSGTSGVDVGRLHGRPGDYLSDTYYNQDSPCTNCTTVSGIPVALTANPNWFFQADNLPLANWNFLDLWQENVGQFPTFIRD